MAARPKRTATAVNLDSQGTAAEDASTRAKRPRQTAYPQHLVLQGFTPLGNTNAATLQQQLPPYLFNTSASFPAFATSGPSLATSGPSLALPQPLMLAPAPPQLNGPPQSLVLAAPPVTGPPLIGPSSNPGNGTVLQPYSSQVGLAQSQQRLHAMTHAARVDMVQQRQETTKTGPTYARHINNYNTYWSTAQDAYCAQDPTWTRVPAFPITATKAALFIRFETQRPKLVKSKSAAQSGAEYQQGTTVGVESIKQAISALEAYRKDHAWEHPPDHETQIKLRDDLRIRTIEEDAAKNESQRVDSAQKLKAAGTSTDTYTVDDLIALSRNCLCSATTAHQLVVDVRDRAMLLLSAQMAFRGDNLRNIQLSDVFSTRKPNVKAGPDCYFEIMGIYADQGKTNQHSRVDEFGALRHKRPELCAVGALALHFFVLWHPELGKEPLPSFAPDFSDAAKAEGFGKYGKRGWYPLYVFRPDGQSCSVPMKYSNHYKRVKKMHEAANVSISKATHAGRSNAAQTAREHGATVNDTKALGLWNESGSYRNCYDRLLPLGAMLGAAHHVADRPEAFFVARAALEPPPELLRLIFPWVEGEQAALEARQKADSACRDFALQQFLDMLKWMRRILVQDLAVFYSMQPRLVSNIFKYKPFDLPIFDTFARGVASRIAEVERTARLHLDQLPERIADGFRSTIQEVGMQQRAENESIRHVLSGFQQQITALAGVMVELKQYEPRAPSQPFAVPTSQPATYRTMVAAYQGHLTSMSLGPAINSGRTAVGDTTMLGSQLPAAAASFMSTPQSPPVTPATSVSGSHSSPSLTTFYMPAPGLSSAEQVQSTSATSVARTSSASPPLALYTPPTATAPSLPPAPFHELPIPVALPAAPLAPPMPMFTPNLGDPAALLLSWQDICTRYSAQLPQIEAHRVAGDWRPSKDGRSWVPVYTFSGSTGLLELWKEWTEGCDGKLSVEALETGWASSWRTSQSARTAYCRRSRVVSLMRKLMEQQRGWNIHHAIRFLHSKGPDYRKHTALYKLLSSSGTEGAILAAASTYKF